MAFVFLKTLGTGVVMQRLIAVGGLLVLIALSLPAMAGKAPPVSEDSQACLDCHATATPDIVADWRRGLMSRTTPAMALKKPELQRQFSAAKKDVPAALRNTVVGCAECHTRNPASHADTFDHEGFQVHTVVSPRDCAVCHPVEKSQFQQNLMGQARRLFIRNPLYMDLASKINGVLKLDGDKLAYLKPTPADEAESCLYCHGTEVKVVGKVTRDMGDFGEMTFPKLSGWPNRGVGRKNPDGSLGSCTACHTRHQFAMHQARQPQSCSQCHKGPDVPAYKIYQVSKHGNIYNALKSEWNFKAVPWTVGKDFTAPTCAACHASLLVDAEGVVIAKRTHAMTPRLWVRLLGLIYSHPHPKKADTSIIKNKDGMTLPTALDGTPALKYLISPSEQARRKKNMTKICLSCHSTQWVQGQWSRLDASIKSSDAMVAAATGLMTRAWKQGLAQGPAQGGSPFDEYLERLWVEQWLFYANSVRYATAMMGADFGVFANGRWYTTKTVLQMKAWMDKQK